MNLATTGPPRHRQASATRSGGSPLAAWPLLSLLLTLVGSPAAVGQPDTTPATPRTQEPILPLPRTLPNPDIDLILLGERLFHDARLSSDGSIACANCHPIPRAGADGLALSPGVGGRLGDMNSPTVFNSGYNLAQFWDGRAETLEAQVDGPVTNPLEMAGSWSEAIARLKQDTPLSKAFRKVFNRPWDRDGIEIAIAAYERSLLTPTQRSTAIAAVTIRR